MLTYMSNPAHVGNAFVGLFMIQLCIFALWQAFREVIIVDNGAIFFKSGITQNVALSSAINCYHEKKRFLQQ